MLEDGLLSFAKNKKELNDAFEKVNQELGKEGIEPLDKKEFLALISDLKMKDDKDITLKGIREKIAENINDYLAKDLYYGVYSDLFYTSVNEYCKKCIKNLRPELNKIKEHIKYIIDKIIFEEEKEGIELDPSYDRKTASKIKLIPVGDSKEELRKMKKDGFDFQSTNALEQLKRLKEKYGIDSGYKKETNEGYYEIIEKDKNNEKYSNLMFGIDEDGQIIDKTKDYVMVFWPKYNAGHDPREIGDTKGGKMKKINQFEGLLDSKPKNVILVKLNGEWKTFGGTNKDKLEEDSRYEALIEMYGKENLKLTENKDLDKTKKNLNDEPRYELGSARPLSVSQRRNGEVSADNRYTEETRKILEKLGKLATAVANHFGWDPRVVFEDFVKDLRIINKPSVLAELDPSNPIDVMTRDLMSHYIGNEEDFNVFQNQALAQIMNMSEERAVQTLASILGRGQIGTSARTRQALGNRGARKLGYNDSQSQEIGRVYEQLKEKYGYDFDDLVYGQDGFMQTKYPDGFPDFYGDVIFSEKYWNEFEKWLKEEKGIELKHEEETEFWDSIRKPIKDMDPLQEYLKETKQEPIFEFDNGDPLFVEFENGKLYAGVLTNTGVMHDYEMDYDFDLSIENNLSEFYNQIIQENPDLLGEIKEEPKQNELSIAILNKAAEILGRNKYLKINDKDEEQGVIRLVQTDELIEMARPSMKEVIEDLIYTVEFYPEEDYVHGAIYSHLNMDTQSIYEDELFDVDEVEMFLEPISEEELVDNAKNNNTWE